MHGCPTACTYTRHLEPSVFSAFPLPTGIRGTRGWRACTPPPPPHGQTRQTAPPACVLSTARPAAPGRALHVAVGIDRRSIYGQYARYATAPQSRGTGHQWNVTFFPPWPGGILPRRGQGARSSAGLDGRGLLGLDGHRPSRGDAGANGMPPNRWAETRHRLPPAPRPGRFREVLARHAAQSPARRDSHSGVSPVPSGPSIPAAQPSGLRSRDEPFCQRGRDAPSTPRPSPQSGASVPAPA